MAATLTIVGDYKAGKAFAEMRGDAGKMATSVDKVDRELQQAVKTAQKLRTETKGGFSGLSMQMTGFNQGLEIGKKGVEAMTHAVLALAAEGNPAALELTESFGGLYNEMIAIGDDPVIVDTMKALSSVMKNDVIPAVSQVPSYLGAMQNGLAGIITSAGEFTGFFPEGTTEALKEDQQRLAEVHDQQLEINREARMTALIYGRITDIEGKLAEESEAAAINQLKDRRTLNDLLEDEIDIRKDLAEAGELSGKKLEESDKKIETIKRRLIALSKEQADAEIKAAQEASAARAKALDDYREWVKELEQTAAEARQVETETLQASKDAAVAELQQAIAEAKSILQPGKRLLDGLRSQVSEKDVGKDLIANRRQKAREAFIDENRGKVDLDGRASGNTDAERRANQARIDRQIKAAEDKAERDFRRQATRGGLDEGEVRAARDARVLQNAERGGLKGTAGFEALQREMEQQRQAFEAEREQQRALNRTEIGAASPKDQQRFQQMRQRAERRLGGPSQQADDQAMQEFARTAGQGTQAVGSFAQTATQGIGQLSALQQQQTAQLNALEQQMRAILDGNRDAAARAKAQRTSL